MASQWPIAKYDGVSVSASGEAICRDLLRSTILWWWGTIIRIYLRGLGPLPLEYKSKWNFWSPCLWSPWTRLHPVCMKARIPFYVQVLGVWWAITVRIAIIIYGQNLNVLSFALALLQLSDLCFTNMTKQHVWWGTSNPILWLQEAPIWPMRSWSHPGSIPGWFYGVCNLYGIKICTTHN